MVFQREQLKRTPLKQQVHAAFRAQNITDVESPNAHQIRTNIKAIETQRKEIQARHQALADVAALHNATRTPLEHYNVELTKLKAESLRLYPPYVRRHTKRKPRFES